MISRFRLLVFTLVFTVLQACGNSGDVDKFLQAEEVADKNLVALELSAKSLRVNAGDTVQFKVSGVTKTGLKLNIDDSVEWESADTAVVTVDDDGLATAQADGTADVTVRMAHLSASLSFVVSTASLSGINLQAALDTVDECRTVQYSVMGMYDDGSERFLSEAVSWTSSDESLAGISSEADGAVVKTFSGGEVEITAASDGVSASHTLTIEDSLVSFQVSPRNVIVSVKASQQYTATGTWADGTTGEMTESTQWSVTDTDIAEFDTDVSGLLTALSEGETGLVAECGGEIVNQPVTTQTNEVDAVKIYPENNGRITLDTGDDGYQLSLRAVYTDNSEVDVTEDADWDEVSGSDSTIRVSDDKGSRGELAITGTGSAIIEATYKSFSGSVLVVVE